MEPSPRPPADRPPATTPEFRARLPLGIRLGLGLALGALAMTGVSWAWNFIIRPAMVASGDLVTTIEITDSVGMAQELLLGLGFFLIYRGLAALLPGSLPWSRWGALLVLAGTLVLASGGIGLTFLFVATFPPNGQYVSPLAFYGVYALISAGGLAVGGGTVAALFGIARGALARMTPPPAMQAP